MTPSTEALRAILKQYIGPAYDRALRNTGEEAAAREATRRTMELLKRACLDGVEPTKALVLRITDDCCNENAFFNRQLEAEAARSQAGEQAGPGLPDAPPAAAFRAPGPLPAAQGGPPPPQAAGTGAAGLESPSAGAPPAGPAKAGRHGAAGPEGPAPLLFAGEGGKRKRKKEKERVSVGSVLLVMLLSLVIVVLVVMLVVMLMSSGVLPDGGTGLASDFAAWFNAHIFPLY